MHEETLKALVNAKHAIFDAWSLTGTALSEIMCHDEATSVRYDVSRIQRDLLDLEERMSRLCAPKPQKPAAVPMVIDSEEDDEQAAD